MKKSILALSIVASLSIAGCGNDAKVENKVSYEDHIIKSLQADTQLKFDVLTAPILPTFMAMDTFDATLSTDGSVGDRFYSTNLNDPATALGKTDGWSVSQPIVIPFNGELNLISAQGAVYLIETTSPLEGTPSVVKILRNDTSTPDFSVMTQNGKLIIFPNKPLNPKSDYMFAVTNTLVDSNGEPVGMSNSYAALKTTVNPPIEDLIKPQGFTHIIEDTVAKAEEIDPTSIIYSSWFTTGSVGDVLDTTKAVIAETIGTVIAGGKVGDVWKGQANPNNLNLDSLYQASITQVEDIETFFINNPSLKALLGDNEALLKGLAGKYTSNNIKVYKGNINLPYYLEDNVSNEAWRKTPWQSAVPSLAKIKYIMSEGSDVDKAAVLESLDGIDITKLLSGDSKEFIKLIGLKVILADGSQLDEERVITQYSPLPQIKAVKEVPFLLIVPNVANPGVTIYQHGITSVKETAYLFGEQHISDAASPKAIIAIDHPLHGERALSDKIITTPETADYYMNLEYLNVARDNIRQSIIDGLSLRTTLALMKIAGKDVFKDLNVLDIADFNIKSDVSFFGHSLGAITGIGTYRLGNDLIGDPKADILFNFTSGAFANPGGGIPYLLLESDTFGPTIKHSLMIGAKENTYIAACGTSENGGACFTTFYESLDDTAKEKIDTTFAEFAYAAQTVLDTVDPYNLASGVNGSVYVMQAYKDKVIPNQTSEFGVIGGTEPLITQLGLADLSTYNDGEVRHAARFNSNSNAEHSSVIAIQSKDSALATKEAQRQVATFSAYQGKGITVQDSHLIAPETP